MTKLTRMENGLRNVLARIRGSVLRVYLWMHACQAGRGLKCKQWPLFRTAPAGNIRIGEHVTIGHRITLHASQTGQIVLGNCVDLTQDIVISSASQVSIGDHSLIAENVSIRDADHATVSVHLIAEQAMLTEPVSLGRDVWIAAGSIILRGSHIPDGAVIGANSLVSRTSQLQEYGIHVGSPVRFIKMRNCQS